MEVFHGIVLAWYGIADGKRIINLYTKERGFLACVTPSFIIKRRNTPVNYLQLVEAEIEINTKNNLHRVISITSTCNLSSLYIDIYKMNIALLWSEILAQLLRREDSADSNLYDYIYQSIEYLQSAGKEAANFNLFFFYRISSLLGFRIDVETYQEGYVFNLQESCFSLPTQEAKQVTGPNAACVIQKLLTCKVEELPYIKLDRQSRNRLLDIILNYYTIHLNTNFNTQALKIIREVFD